MAYTVNYINNLSYFTGQSTDTKPANASVGSFFYEENTGNTYRFSNLTGWYLAEKEAPILLTDTTALTGTFTCIEAYTDCTFSLLTSNITKNGTTTPLAVADVNVLAEGKRIYGVFTAITLTSGKLWCYR